MKDLVDFDEGSGRFVILILVCWLRHAAMLGAANSGMAHREEDGDTAAMQDIRKYRTYQQKYPHLSVLDLLRKPRLPSASKEAGLTLLDLLVMGPAHREDGGDGLHADGGGAVEMLPEHELKVADRKPRADGCLAGGSLALSSWN